AVPKTLVDSCTKAVTAAGLVPIMIEPSINAVARVLEATEEGHLPTMIIDIGPASTDIAILANSAIRVSGAVSVGGNTFTLDIAKKLNIALENAHQLKVLNWLNAGPRQAKITGALKPSLQRILSEVNKVMRYYNERLNNEHKIEQVIIVGAGSNVPGIGDYFTNELVMAVRVASPWQKLDFGKLPQPAKQFRPRYITVAGLASIDRQEIWK
ncbi:MAG: pilus assembly protein PilM, partial [Candidatus Saccharimonadales bacterium]